MLKKLSKFLGECVGVILDRPRDPMFIVSYSVDANAMDGGEDWLDHFEVVETLKEARDIYARVVWEEGAKCAAISFVIEATEPHWEGE